MKSRGRKVGTPPAMPPHDTRATGGRPRRAFLGKLFDVTNYMKEGEGLLGRTPLGVGGRREASPHPDLGQTHEGRQAARSRESRRGGSAGSATRNGGVRAPAGEEAGTGCEERRQALKWNKAQGRNGRRLIGNGEQAQRTQRWSKALESSGRGRSVWSRRLSQDGGEGSRPRGSERQEGNGPGEAHTESSDAVSG